MFLFTDSLLTKASRWFLISHIDESSHYVESSKKLCHDYKFLGKCGQGESFCIYSSLQYIWKTCWRFVNKTSFPWVIRLEDVLKTTWRSLESILWRCMTMANILVFIETLHQDKYLLGKEVGSQQWFSLYLQKIFFWEQKFGFK